MKDLLKDKFAVISSLVLIIITVLVSIHLFFGTTTTSVRYVSSEKLYDTYVFRGTLRVKGEEPTYSDKGPGYHKWVSYNSFMVELKTSTNVYGMIFHEAYVVAE